MRWPPMGTNSKPCFFHLVALAQEGLLLIRDCSARVRGLLHTRAPGFVCYLPDAAGSPSSVRC